jgi:hypothetical protein
MASEEQIAANKKYIEELWEKHQKKLAEEEQRKAAERKAEQDGK